jgi:hypothetical protein
MHSARATIPYPRKNEEIGPAGKPDARTDALTAPVNSFLDQSSSPHGRPSRSSSARRHDSTPFSSAHDERQPNTRRPYGSRQTRPRTARWDRGQAQDQGYLCVRETAKYLIGGHRCGHAAKGKTACCRVNIFQGLKPLANDLRPSGSERRTGPRGPSHWKSGTEAQATR